MLRIFYYYVLSTTHVWSISSFINKAYPNSQNQGDKFSDVGGFKAFLAPFDPKTVWEKLDKEQQRKGANYSTKEYIDKFYQAVDITDSLLKLKVKNGDARLVLGKDGRRWEPPAGVLQFTSNDRFSLRPRLYALMQQAIYQSRNKMVGMQKIREQYKESNLYKMGYLMSKTDNACKTFAKFAFRAYRACGATRGNVFTRMTQYDVLVLEERLIHLWFTVQLLTELIYHNDDLLHDTVEQHETDRKAKWPFVD